MALPGSLPAQMVANKFVTQYYTVLHQMPQIAHRFYADSSCLVRAEADRRQIAETPNEIHIVVTSLDHESWQPEIYTVDALNSFGGSVFVVVTGAMHQNNSTRKFVQSFILAPQVKGFYVLNDILRYLDETTESAAVSFGRESFETHDDYDSSQIVSNKGAVDLDCASAVPETQGLSSSTMGVDTVARDEMQHRENGRDIEQRAIEEAFVYQSNEIVTPANLSSFEQLSLEDDPRLFSREEALGEKKSYAEILQLQQDSRMLAQTPFIFHEITSPQQQRGFSHQSSSQFPSSHPSKEEIQEPSLLETEVDPRSVYVRNLPPNMADRQLEDVMRKFGPVKSNSVSVRTNKEGVVYAFVDFEDSNAAQAAIEASPMSVGGRKINVEGRTSVYLGGRGRGRGRGQGRGVFESNGTKARGSGRGYGDGEALGQDRGSRSTRTGYT